MSLDGLIEPTVGRTESVVTKIETTRPDYRMHSLSASQKKNKAKARAKRKRTKR